MNAAHGQLNAERKLLRLPERFTRTLKEALSAPETIAYDKFMEVGGSMAAAKEKGFLRSEGKEYVMKDGDIVDFLFNV